MALTREQRRVVNESLASLSEKEHRSRAIKPRCVTACIFHLVVHPPNRVKMIRCPLQIPFRENFTLPKRGFGRRSKRWNVPLPNEDFGRRNKRWNADFRSSFQRFLAQIEYSHPWKVLRKSALYLLFLLPKSSFEEHKFRTHDLTKELYAPQTKILEVRANISYRVFKELFNGQSPQWSTHVCKKCVEKNVQHVCSTVQNLRLGIINLRVLSINCAIYAPQTKILEGWTTNEMRIFETIFYGEWPKWSTITLEKCFENLHFICCYSFQNLRLGGVKCCRQQPSATHPRLKGRFWQTCLVTIFPKLWTSDRGWNIWKNRDKAGLSKTGVSCRRLVDKVYAPQTTVLENLCSPNEDFGRPNQPFRTRFRSTFQGC